MQKTSIKLGLAFITAVLTSSIPGFAAQFRTIKASEFATLGTAKGSVVFRGVVENIEAKNGVQEVSFKVKEGLRGEAKADQLLTLKFPTARQAGKLLIKPNIDAPHFSKGDEVVLFITQNQRGEHFLIGGEQSLFKVESVAGKTVVKNALGNLNLIENDTAATGTSREVSARVSADPAHHLAYEDLKKLLGK